MKKPPSALAEESGFKPEPIRIVFSPHALKRIGERLGADYQFRHNGFVRLLSTRDASDRGAGKNWCLPVTGGYLLGRIVQSKHGGKLFVIRTALSAHQFKRSQQDGGFTPFVARLFAVGAVVIE